MEREALYIMKSKRRAQERGIDPASIPEFKKTMTDEELARKHFENSPSQAKSKVGRTQPNYD
ncbi:hypothetical protein [Aneurinibacillus terranovensis]|uniref:hypothetical protein n=1 Tax=Aneurinibacillus terranovensis TaxID=278991 RepID=UPI0003FC206D|nr:hypothetical protein [Aneurinibacillus terranovensis]